MSSSRLGDPSASPRRPRDRGDLHDQGDRADRRDSARGEPRRSVLDNGLEVLSVALDGLHDASVIFCVRAGSRYEPLPLNGISHVLEHMMFRGSSAFPSPLALNIAIEELGGTLDATTQVDFTTFELTLPAETFLEGVERFARILERPLLQDLAIEKKILREELLEDLDEEGRDVDVDNLSRRTLFPGHGLGNTITGTIEGVERLTDADLRSYLSAHYVARNSVLVAAGPFDQAEFHALVARCFAFMPEGERTLASPPPAFEARANRVAFVRDPGSQSDVRMSFPAFGEGHPDLVALELALRVLDDGMGSRLPHRLRDQLGIVYDAFAAFDPYEDSGIVDLGGSVAHTSVLELVRELWHLCAALRRELVGDDELERVRRRYLWDLDRLLDDAHAVASFHSMRAIFGRTQTIDALRAAAMRTTAEDLRRVAHAVFVPSRCHLAVVGGMNARAEEKVRAFVMQLTD